MFKLIGKLVKLALALIAILVAVAFFSAIGAARKAAESARVAPPSAPSASAAPNSSPEPSAPAASSLSPMPEVSTFLESHAEWGTPTSAQSEPDWAEGKRQRVEFGSGRSLLFYLKNGQVVTVLDEQRQKIWGEYSAPKLPPPTVHNPADASLAIPAYSVLYSGPQVRGAGKPMGKRGDILILSLSRKSSPAEVEEIGRAIAKKEGYIFAAFYSTEDAYKANESASYLKEHPQALVKGFLGDIGGSLTDPNITEGVWHSGEEMFPEPKPSPKAKGKPSRKR